MSQGSEEAVFRPRLAALDDALTRSLRNHVHDALRMAIISGRIGEKQRLKERELAADLGVSTTPLKEALRQLEAEGLVHSEPRRGVRVTFGRAWAEEMILARAALEAAIASVAAQKVQNRPHELRSIVADMERATRHRGGDELLTINKRFHREIHQISGCAYLSRMIERQKFYDDSQAKIIHSDPKEGEKALLEHTGVAAAVMERNPELAERRMRDHVMRSGARYMQVAFGSREQE